MLKYIKHPQHIGFGACLIIVRQSKFTKESYNMEILRKAIKAFIGDVDFKDPVTVGNGHINSTYLVKTNNNSYCLQKINTSIFRDLDGLMNNIEAVTEHIREKSIALGRNPYRSTLKFLTANTGKSYVLIDGAAYRMYHYIDDVFTIEKMEKAEHFYLSGVAFGEFARFLSDFDASVLSETIKNFHNTVSRYNDFEMATGNSMGVMGYDSRIRIKGTNKLDKTKSPIPTTLLNNSITQYCSRPHKIMFILQKSDGEDTYNKLFYEIKKDLILTEQEVFADELKALIKIGI